MVLFRRFSTLLLLLAVLPACGAKMQNRLDAVWEHFDPMGHRKGHQVRHYPRANNPGMRVPDDDEDKLLKKAQKESRYAVPMAGYGRGPDASRQAAPYALQGTSGAAARAVSPDGYALPGSSMARPVQ